MGFLDSLRAWFRTEAEEAKDAARQAKGRLEADLDRREAELRATPEERLEQLQRDIADGDTTFEDLQAKIDGRAAKADATADVADLDSTRDEDVLDLESEEVIPPEPPPGH